MPKSFSDSEREYIIKRLKEEAKECLNLYGIKKTTVDELVRRVNIAKGTFYLFYDSKEMLLFDAINDLHDEIQVQLFNEIKLINGKIDCENLTALLFKLYKSVDNTFLLKAFTNGELDLLIRKLPHEAVEKHLAQDDQIMEMLKEAIPSMTEKDVKCFSGALRGVFMTMLYKREIGEEIFDESLRLMLRGLAIQMTEE